MAIFLKKDEVDTSNVKMILPKGLEFQLEELYAILECDMIEIVPVILFGREYYMVIDEEGKLKPDNQVNKVATSIYLEQYGGSAEGYRQNKERLKAMAEKSGGFFIDATPEPINGFYDHEIVGHALVCPKSELGE